MQFLRHGCSCIRCMREHTLGVSESDDRSCALRLPCAGTSAAQACTSSALPGQVQFWQKLSERRSGISGLVSPPKGGETRPEIPQRRSESSCQSPHVTSLRHRGVGHIVVKARPLVSPFRLLAQAGQLRRLLWSRGGGVVYPNKIILYI